jgi:hypothetical protein
VVIAAVIGRTVGPTVVAHEELQREDTPREKKGAEVDGKHPSRLTTARRSTA